MAMIPVTMPIERALRASKMFGGLDPSLLSNFARSAVRHRFRRGESIWRTGDPSASVTVIAVGLVKIVQRMPDGASSIMGIFGPHETIGAMALHQGTYPADAIAASDTVEILAVEKTPVLSALSTTPALAHALHLTLVEHCQALQEKIRIMSAGCVERRLATLLQYLTDRFGDEMDDGIVSVPVVLSRSELASLIGATVETTIRTMSRWQKSGVVETTHEGFRIRDPQRLEAIVSPPTWSAGTGALAR